MASIASVTYLHHSGFAVAVDSTLLIFDYWQGGVDPLPEDARITEADFANYKQILVFVSHIHEDHYDSVIYTWGQNKQLPITYVVSDDLPIGVRGKRMKAGDTVKLGEVQVAAYDSTDAGVSFYVTVGGLHIFHAGDLNLWHWREESSLREITAAENAYYAAVEPIAALPIDIAMFPVDPRLGGLFDAGANHFILDVKPRVFIPMHWQGRAEVALDYARRTRTRYTEVLALTMPRERAELTFDDASLHIQVFTARADALMRKKVQEAAAEAEVKLDAYAADDPFSDTDLPVTL